MKVYEALAQGLAAEGVEVMFGVAGYGNLDILTELTARHDVRFIATRHEQGAVAMADGFSRVSGKPGYCTVTQGPGVTNTATALTTACRHRSQIVLFAGRSAVANRHDVQGLDQRRFVEACGAPLISIRDQRTVADDLQQAFRHVRNGRGPVVIDAAVDTQHQTVNQPREYVRSSEIIQAPQSVQPDPAAVRAAAEALATAKRPILLAGRGAVESDAGRCIAQLAEHLAAPLATTVQAKDYFRGHPLAIGIAGGLASAHAKECFAASDCVVAIGASVNIWTTRYGRLFPNARLVHVDLDPKAMGNLIPVDVGVIGDARGAIELLLDTISFAPRDAWAEHSTSHGPDGTNGPAEFEDGLNPHAVVTHLDKILPQERTLAIDGGHQLAFTTPEILVPHPSASIFSLDFGSIGLALPLAIGAAIGEPDRLAVAAVGDGGFMMSVQELETAARSGIRIVVIVMNDHAYGGELRQLEAKDKSFAGVLFDNPDFGAVARSLGARGETITSLQQLHSIDPGIFDSPEPLVLDIKISRQVRHGFVEESTQRAPWQDVANAEHSSESSAIVA